MKGDEGCRADCAARWFLTGFLPADGGGHGVELGAGVLAILVSDCGSSRVDPRVQVIHGVLPFGHLGHPAVAFTHCHTKGRRSEQILLTACPHRLPQRSSASYTRFTRNRSGPSITVSKQLAVRKLSFRAVLLVCVELEEKKSAWKCSLNSSNTSSQSLTSQIKQKERHKYGKK